MHPILLHKDHWLSTLFTRRSHERVLHNGVKETLTELRSRFWIVKGRSFIKKLIRQCVVCRRFEGKSYVGPPPPPLPAFRLKEAPPFTHTGVDYAGPLFIKTEDPAKEVKAWICLYTCCVVRAIHLDVVPDMTTAAFLRSLKRFTARRGLPRKFVSDNGKTFKAAAKTIEAVMRDQDVQQYLSGIGVEWSFNIERAPWWVRVFERMVRSTKRCLKKMIGQAKLNYDELVTAVTEVEMVINSRPLSYVTQDDLDEPLTPAHFLTGRRLLSLPDTIYSGFSEDDSDVTPTCLHRRLRYLNSVLNHFWRRWKIEYLLELRESHRYQGMNSIASPISIGDVVLVHDEGKARGFWKLARVEDLVTGRDGLVRGAVLRVASRKGRATVLRRPVQRLYPLEIHGPAKGDMQDATCVDQNTLAEVDGNREEDSECPIPKRPRRAAAAEAKDRLKALALYEDNC